MCHHNYDKPKAMQTITNGTSVLQFFVVLAVVVAAFMQMKARAHNAFAGCTCHISYVRRYNCSVCRVAHWCWGAQMLLLLLLLLTQINWNGSNPVLCNK